VGQKITGDMYCDRCDRPVPAVKNTHRLRNSLGVLALPATGGLSAAGMKGERYVCPICGGHVHATRVSPSLTARVQMKTEERAELRPLRQERNRERVERARARAEARRQRRAGGQRGPVGG